MYTRLNNRRTKKYYREVVNLAIKETRDLIAMSPEVIMYHSIYNQLIDIKLNIIEKNKIFSRFELYRRYSLGNIAVKNFKGGVDEYSQKLIDSYGGAFDYYKMPEE